jgi:hypothetical protein
LPSLRPVVVENGVDIAHGAFAKPKMLFSILIPTLQERRASFTRLYEKLRAQIVRAGVEDAVEIVTRCDKREHTLGAKRNVLMRDARGDAKSLTLI